MVACAGHTVASVTRMTFFFGGGGGWVLYFLQDTCVTAIMHATHIKKLTIYNAVLTSRHITWYSSNFWLWKSPSNCYLPIARHISRLLTLLTTYDD